eukprot:1317678-Amorphochlora_amoeboformis.AAC.1
MKKGEGGGFENTTHVGTTYSHSSTSIPGSSSPPPPASEKSLPPTPPATINTTHAEGIPRIIYGGIKGGGEGESQTRSAVWNPTEPMSFPRINPGTQKIRDRWRCHTSQMTRGWFDGEVISRF